MGTRNLDDGTELVAGGLCSPDRRPLVSERLLELVRCCDHVELHELFRGSDVVEPNAVGVKVLLMGVGVGPLSDGSGLV